MARSSARPSFETRPMGAPQDEGWCSHPRRQEQRDDREYDQNYEPQDVSEDERHHAIEDGGDPGIIDHALDDEDVHADRRVDQAELDRHHDDDAEPDRVEAELL